MRFNLEKTIKEVLKTKIEVRNCEGSNWVINYVFIALLLFLGNI